MKKQLLLLSLFLVGFNCSAKTNENDIDIEALKELVKSQEEEIINELKALYNECPYFYSWRSKNEQERKKCNALCKDIGAIELGLWLVEVDLPSIQNKFQILKENQSILTWQNEDCRRLILMRSFKVMRDAIKKSGGPNYTKKDIKYFKKNNNKEG